MCIKHICYKMYSLYHFFPRPISFKFIETLWKHVLINMAGEILATTTHIYIVDLFIIKIMCTNAGKNLESAKTSYSVMF